MTRSAASRLHELSSAPVSARRCMLLALAGLLAVGPLLAATGGADRLPRRSRARAAAVALFCYGTRAGGANLLEHDHALARRLARLRGFCASLVRENGFVAGEVERVLPPAVLLAVPLALAYGVRHQEDGLRAVDRCAAACVQARGEDARKRELREERACGRAAYVLVSRLIAGEPDRDRILRLAARVCGEERLARKLLTLRVLEWREMSDAVAGEVEYLTRACKTWYHARSAAGNLRAIAARLRAPRARRLAAILCGAAYGTGGLPEELVARAVNDRDLCALVGEISRLGNERVLVQVPAANAAAGVGSTGAVAAAPVLPLEKNVLLPRPAVAGGERRAGRRRSRCRGPNASAPPRRSPPLASPAAPGEKPEITAARPVAPSPATTSLPPMPPQPVAGFLSRPPRPPAPPPVPAIPEVPGIPDISWR